LPAAEGSKATLKTSETNHECRKFRVEGRVQGVWFRESTRQQAGRLGIRGYAVNRSDGSVEVLACGDRQALDVLADWLAKGPRLARVQKVTAERYDGDCPAGFTTG
jgi:acylphosphatase